MVIRRTNIQIKKPICNDRSEKSTLPVRGDTYRGEVRGGDVPGCAHTPALVRVPTHRNTRVDAPFKREKNESIISYTRTNEKHTTLPVRGDTYRGEVRGGGRTWLCKYTRPGACPHAPEHQGRCAH